MQTKLTDPQYTRLRAEILAELGECTVITYEDAEALIDAIMAHVDEVLGSD